MPFYGCRGTRTLFCTQAVFVFFSISPNHGLPSFPLSFFSISHLHPPVFSLFPAGYTCFPATPTLSGSVNSPSSPGKSRFPIHATHFFFFFTLSCLFEFGNFLVTSSSGFPENTWKGKTGELWILGFLFSFGLVWLTVDDQLHPTGLKGLCLAVRLTWLEKWKFILFYFSDFEFFLVSCYFLSN